MKAAKVSTQNLTVKTNLKWSWLYAHLSCVGNYAGMKWSKIGRFPEQVLRISREFNT